MVTAASSSLLKKGVSQAEVARMFEVSRQSVSRWAAALEQAGNEGLRFTGFRGRRPGLTIEQLEQLEKILQDGSEAQGYATALWTLSVLRQGHSAFASVFSLAMPVLVGRRSDRAELISIREALESAT